MLTDDAILLLALQLADGDKVTLHHGHVAAVLAGDDAGLGVQGHLVVVLHRRVLLVGDLQRALGDVVDLEHRRGGWGGVLGGESCTAADRRRKAAYCRGAVSA